MEDQNGGVVPLNDVYNRRNQKTYSSSDQPHIFVTSFNYQTPKLGPNNFVKSVTGGWTFGGILRYSSGFVIRTPTSNNRYLGMATIDWEKGSGGVINMPITKHPMIT